MILDRENHVAAALAVAGVNYVSPVNGAKEAAVKQDPKVGNNPLMLPTEDDYATKFHVFRPLTAKEDNDFSKLWSDAANGVV